ncbi:hypothetical protein K449DRAFT_340870 [Hypoxylon sp. EC38]|nr:hypothetical protein K449DRAFT_340870 [Hypoxylon sp. EC38]
MTVVSEFGPPEVLKWETWDPYAELSADQALVRIITAGIAGPDNLQRVGGYPDPRSSKPGFTPGYDFVGEVIALGSASPEDSLLACSPSKFNYVKSLGVIPVDRNAPDLVEQVLALTNGEGVDVAYDAVGSEDSLRKSHLSTKKDIGVVIAIGIMAEITQDGSGLSQEKFDPNALLTARWQPRMERWSVDQTYYKKMRQVWMDDFYTILDKVRKGELRPTIAKLLRLSEAVGAHRLLISGTTVKGKMLFLVDEDLATQHGL